METASLTNYPLPVQGYFADLPLSVIIPALTIVPTQFPLTPKFAAGVARRYIPVLQGYAMWAEATGVKAGIVSPQVGHEGGTLMGMPNAGGPLNILWPFPGRKVSVPSKDFRVVAENSAVLGVRLNLLLRFWYVEPAIAQQFGLM